ncbi:hypothetical protein EVAR_61271_1 [Eumeta japonica]|uniref:Uncharacterized protein n=1 Tax=Eumeta variegata TaxID=151549 RepID=A0A4C1Z2X6_EUMVA|nr:hypothetical protein EVAR_61271_1 [Eumeta japonica]
MNIVKTFSGYEDALRRHLECRFILMFDKCRCEGERSARRVRPRGRNGGLGNFTERPERFVEDSETSRRVSVTREDTETYVA